MKIHTTVTLVHDTDNLIIRDVPVSSTLVELPGDCLVIIDTGMAGNPQLLQWLNELGYKPEDVNLVINTHLHQDHVGGNRLFTNARILISRRELEYEAALNRLLQEASDPAATVRSLGRQVPQDGERLLWDLKRLAQEFPTPSLVGDPVQLEYFENEPSLPKPISLINVPGHSIDTRAILLQGRYRQALATGDALYHRDLWKGVQIMGIHYDEALFRQNAERIARFRGIIIPGHDHAYNNVTGKYLPDDSFSL